MTSVYLQDGYIVLVTLQGVPTRIRIEFNLTFQATRKQRSPVLFLIKIDLHPCGSFEYQKFTVLPRTFNSKIENVDLEDIQC